MELNEYLKKSNELLGKGLTFDEVDHVLHGDITLEEALEHHKIAVLNETADSEYKESCKTGGKERERRRNRGGHDQRSDQDCTAHETRQAHRG